VLRDQHNDRSHPSARVLPQDSEIGSSRGGTRVFNLEDQRRFAHLSGDYNPLHLDPLVCRRSLFGEPVVHGVHLLLWILDQVLQSAASPIVLRGIKAAFRRPLALDMPVDLEEIRLDAEGFRATASGRHCQVSAEFFRDASSPLWSVAVPVQETRLPCRPLSLEQAARAEGSIALWMRPDELASLFPYVAEKLPAVQTAQLLATTRLTGMECPGLYSLFDALDLRFLPEPGQLALHYQAGASDPRFSLLRLRVRGFGMEGELSTLLRPAPVQQPSLDQVQSKVAQDEYRDQRALVVGGSRGLGEVTAKIIAAGGGHVRLTYHRGADDADRVVRELSTLSGDIACFPLDVTQNAAAALRSALGDWRPTHLYYFATPHVGRTENLPFSPSKFSYFCRYFVQGLADVLDGLGSGQELAVFYPSSHLVDQPAQGFGEYAAAKAAGESLGRNLHQRWPAVHFHIVRLPRLRTDQTVTLLPQSAVPDVLEVLSHAIRRFSLQAHPLDRGTSPS